MKEPDLTLKFWLFAFLHYYPSGGLADVIDASDNPYDLLANKEKDSFDYWYILDKNTGKYVREGRTEIYD